MSDTQLSPSDGGELSREEMQAALFAQLVFQQTNLALMLLGKMPNPQTGETTRDLDSAQLFIDQLEMLETKTRGNLSREEAELLRQSLMTLRMAFVETVESPAEEQKTAPADATGAAEEELRKRFSKKY